MNKGNNPSLLSISVYITLSLCISYFKNPFSIQLVQLKTTGLTGQSILLPTRSGKITQGKNKTSQILKTNLNEKDLKNPFLLFEKQVNKYIPEICNTEEKNKESGAS